jgi:hypothetical protein
MTPGIAREQARALDHAMRAEEEIRQHTGCPPERDSSGTPLPARNKATRDLDQRDVGGRKRRIDLIDAAVADRELGVEHGIDDQRVPGGQNSELSSGPIGP